MNWDEEKVIFTDKFDYFGEERTEANLYDAYIFALDYYKQHEDCYQAGYHVGWCTYVSVFMGYSKIDVDYGIKILKLIYDKGHDNAAYALWKLYFALHDEEEGFYWAKRMVERKPQDDESWIRIAECYSDGKGTLKKPQKATETYEKIKSRNMDNYEFAVSYATHLLEIKHKEAFYWFSKARELAPDEFEEGYCIQGMCESSLLVDHDLMRATKILEELREMAEKLKQSSDVETAKYVRECYSIALNEMYIYKAERGIKE